MVIWALFAGLTAVAVLFVLAPLARGRADAAPAAAGDVAVYRDQLAEIDRDLDAGLVGAEEAEAARAEIGRRLLRAARGDAAAAVSGSTRSRIVAVLAVVLVPAIAVGGYLRLGHPDLPDAPLTARLAEPKADSIDALIARVEAHLAQNPNDVRGWEVLGPVFMKQQRPDDAVRAWRKAIAIAGPSEKRATALGEALVAAGDGVIGDEARAAFRQALALAPQAVLPRMYLAAALLQDDKPAEAVAAWRDLVASATEADPWISVARQELARAEEAAAAAGAPVPPAATPTPSAPGPTADQIDAAAKMSAQDRSTMVADMVARLDERLKTSGGSIDDWERLVRSLTVLGRTDDARAAIERARSAFASDPAALARLDALARP